MPFDRAAGGTRHAPPGLNDANEADPRQWTANGSGACDWVVDFVAEGFAEEFAEGSRGSRVTADVADEDERNEDAVSARWDAWAVTRTFPFLDQANSPALSRAFYVPGWSAAKNAYGKYVVYRRAEREVERDERVS